MTEEVKRLRCAVADLIGENERLTAALRVIEIKSQLPNLKRCLQFELPYNSQLISSIEYEIYISSAETDCEYPYDARDCIITFFQRIPEIIGSYKEGFSGE
ncbi:hypothetical protein P8791_21740 [Bacillus subtilis]|nr:hypothetical protein [Bacillus subtilis]MEC0323739.1 hypothetical protein [Bacillus subtilis]